MYSLFSATEMSFSEPKILDMVEFFIFLATMSLLLMVFLKRRAEQKRTIRELEEEEYDSKEKIELPNTDYDP